MQLIALRSLFYKTLNSLYEKQEIEAIFAHTADFMLSYSKIEIQQNLNRSIDTQHEKKILDCLDRLSKNEPLQYVLGFTEFNDLVFQVDQRVLIPRPETEFLVDIIIKERSVQPNLRIIDLCTGSGCIAITLAKKIPGSQVTATDISLDALDLAKSNADKNKVIINMIHDDLLDSKKNYQAYDLIISNPPYVRESERKAMHKNVLNFEPSIALFVPDSGPLKFYRAIADFGHTHLAENGRIYAEINEQLGEETQSLFKTSGYSKVEIRQDIHRKDRYLIAEP